MEEKLKKICKELGTNAIFHIAVNTKGKVRIIGVENDIDEYGNSDEGCITKQVYFG